MKKKVLISAPYMLRKTEIEKVKSLLDGLNIEYTFAQVKERLEEDELLKIIDQYNGIICGDDRMTPKVYDHARKLEVVVKWGTGIDSLNHEYAQAKGIKLFRTPGAFTEPVSDTTIAYFLSFARGVQQNDLILKSGGWDKPPGFCLFEKTFGLIGFGDIGRAVAKKLKPFGAKVLVNDIRILESSLYSDCGVEMVSKEEIFKTCDFISLHTDLNQASYHMLDQKAFQMMKQKPYIINTARGPLIEEPALINALQSKMISGAGLDVFEEEPLSSNSPLRKMQQVLLASHNSNSSPSSWMKVHINSIKMLKEGLCL